MESMLRLFENNAELRDPRTYGKYGAAVDAVLTAIAADWSILFKIFIHYGLLEVITLPPMNPNPKFLRGEVISMVPDHGGHVQDEENQASSNLTFLSLPHSKSQDYMNAISSRSSFDLKRALRRPTTPQPDSPCGGDLRFISDILESVPMTLMEKLSVKHKSKVFTLVRQTLTDPNMGFLFLCWYGNSQTVEAALLAGANPNRLAHSCLPLHLGAASPHEHYAKTRLLLQHGANVENQAAALRSTVLMQAAKRGDIQLIQLLLQSGASPSIRAKGPSVLPTALFQAAHWGHLGCVELLLAAGADLTNENMYGLKAVDVAQNAWRYAVATKPKHISRLPLPTASPRDYAKIVKMLRRHNPSLSAIKQQPRILTWESKFCGWRSFLILSDVCRETVNVLGSFAAFRSIISITRSPLWDCNIEIDPLKNISDTQDF